MKVLEGVYGMLLRLYPPSFRDEFASDLEQAFRDRGAEPRYAGVGGRVRLALFVVGDLIRSLPTAHMRALREARSAPARRRDGSMSRWSRDVRTAIRGFVRRPGFFLAAVTTLALGVGASTTVFSVADGVVLRPLPYPSPDRLVTVGTRYGGGERLSSSNPQDFFDLQQSASSFESVAASRLESHTLLGDGEPMVLNGAGVSPSYFDVMGRGPARGRAFTEDDDVRGREAVAVISWGLWQRRFGGEPGVVGRDLETVGQRFTIVGVMPRDFHPPESIYHQDVDVWYPLSFVGDDLRQREAGFLQAIGRLAEGATVASATAELETISSAIAAAHPESEGRVWGIAPLRDATVGDAGSTVVVLMAAVGFLLLIACANVANLFLVRATERGRELALRTALGANRRSLVRMLLVEGLVLAVVAAVAAVFFAWAGVAAFRATNPGDLPRLDEVVVNVRVLVFTLATSLLTGIIFAVVPVVASRAFAPGRRLREGGTSLSPSRKRNRLRNGLVVAQTAIAVVLLAGAGLLIHSFVNLQRVDAGFDPEHSVWIQVRIPGARYTSPESRRAFFTDVLRRFAAIPGVDAAGGSENMPMGGNSSRAGLSVEGTQLAPEEQPVAVEYNRVTDGFFEALRSPVLRGRAFTAADDLGGEPVVIVNASLAARLWPAGEAIGSHVKFGRPEDEGEWRRVVGVVADMHQRGLGEPAEPQLYVPWRQSPRTGVAFVVRSRNEPASLLRALKAQVWAVDPTLPFEQMGTLESHVARSIIRPRFYTLLLSTFAGLALVLAFVGLYGTIAYAVEQRTREIGVRMAMGAQPLDVVALIVRRGMTLAAAGLAIGVAGALVATRALGSFVFGITPRDPLTFATTMLALAGASALASWLPARRASRLDPARTLRVD